MQQTGFAVAAVDHDHPIDLDRIQPVRAKLKKGKERYVPMAPELAAAIRRYPAVIDEETNLPAEGRTEE